MGDSKAASLGMESKSKPSSPVTTQAQRAQNADVRSIMDQDSAQEGESDVDGHQQAPLQKRRRVGRACDECRRKKIKCDGKQPCTHCTVYSYGKC